MMLERSSEVGSTTDHEMSKFIQSYPSIYRDYKLIEKIGEGTFSTVWKAVDIHSQDYDNSSWISVCNANYGNNVFIALKKLTRTSSPDRTLEEIAFLRELKGLHNVIPIVTADRHDDQVVMVFPYFKHEDFRDYFRNFTLADIQCYLATLLEAVAHIHEHSIIHRDLKPSNFMYCPKQKRGVLGDFGLAQKYIPYNPNEMSKRSSISTVAKKATSSSSTLPAGYFMNDHRHSMKASRAGTRGFRAPEVLFKVQDQTTAIDMWSVGVILLTLFTGQYPFFNAADDEEALVELALIFGSQQISEAAKKYNRKLSLKIPGLPSERVKWSDLVKNFNSKLNVTEEGYDLLDRLLELDASKRITAKEALEHPLIRQPR